MVFNWFTSDGDEKYDDILDELVTLIRVAQEDEDIHARLVAVLSLPVCDRHDELNKWIKSCETRGAPSHFIASIKLLLDDKIADKTLQALS